MCSRRGATVLELLVTASLLLLLVGMAATILIPVGTTWMRSQKRSDAQQSVVVVMNRLREEMRCSHPEVIEVRPVTATLADGAVVHCDRLAFLSWKSGEGGATFTLGGDLEWQQKMVFYLNPSRGEVMMATSMVPPTQEPRSETLASPLPGAQEKPIARFVRSLAFSRSDDGLIEVRLEAVVDHERASLYSTVGPLMPPPPPGPSPSAVASPPP